MYWYQSEAIEMKKGSVKGVGKVRSFLQLHRQKRQLEQHSLYEEFNKALSYLSGSYRHLDFCDPEYLDSVVFAIGAAERRLVAVLQVARKEGIRAW